MLNNSKIVRLDFQFGFQFDFGEGVDIFFEQRIGLLTEMPHFVHLNDAITFLQCFRQLDAAPRSLNGSLGIGMRARSLIAGIGARFAQREHQFVLTETIGNVLVKILGNNLRVTGRYGLGSVDVGMKAGKVNVPDLFVSLATMVQFGRIGSAAVQGMTWV